MTGNNNNNDNNEKTYSPEEFVNFLKSKEKLNQRAGVEQRDELPIQEEDEVQSEEREQPQQQEMFDPTLRSVERKSSDDSLLSERSNPTTIAGVLGYIEIKKSQLPSKGLFYPKDSRIFIRSLNTEEIRHWSLIEDNIVSSEKHLNNVLYSACKLLNKENKSYNTELITVSDKMTIILAIRDLTFAEQESIMEIPITCKCPLQKETKVNINRNVLIHSGVNDEVHKYYSEEEGCYVIQTKNEGFIRLHHPRIGVFENVITYIEEKTRENRAIDKAFLTVLPYLIKKWNLDDQKEWNKLYNSFISWNTRKFQIINKMIKEISKDLTVKEEIKTQCQHCSKEVSGPFQFPEGIQPLFTISDIDSELL